MNDYQVSATSMLLGTAGEASSSRGRDQADAEEIIFWYVLYIICVHCTDHYIIDSHMENEDPISSIPQLQSTPANPARVAGKDEVLNCNCLICSFA